MKVNFKFLSALAGVAGGYAALTAIGRPPKITFRDKVVVITGGSRGLGLCLARQLAGEGAKLALLARDEAELKRAEQQLTATGAEVLTVPCDVTQQSEVDNAIRQVVSHYGRLEVLVNNAGVIQVGPVEHMTVKDFEDAMAVHLWGPLYTTLAALPHLRRQGSGRIVNISSIGGRISVPHLLPYSASKFALVGLSDGLRSELAKDKIYITTVSPGLMRTGSPPNALFKGRNREEYTWFAIGDGLPGISIDANRAAHQIIEACRRGDSELTITLLARLGVIANNVSPGLTAQLLKLTNALLPKPTGPNGDTSVTGWQSQSPLAPSLLTTLSDKATEENNEQKPSVISNQ